MTLFGKYSGNSFAPDFLHRGENTQLVVDQDIVIRGIEAFDVIELLLFVDVDKDTAVERLPEAASLHLARLEHGIAVRENNRSSPLPHMFHCV